MTQAIHQTKNKATKKKASKLISIIKYILVLTTLILAVLFALLAGAANPILNAYLKDLNQIVSESIGGEIKIKQVEASIFPWFVFELEELELDKMVKVKSLALELDTFTALLSQGEHIKIDRAIIDQVDLKLVKDKTGAWNFEAYGSDRQKLDSNVISKQKIENSDSEQETGSEVENQYTFAELQKRLQGLKIGQVYIKGLKVTVEDQTQVEPQSIQLAEFDWEFSKFEPAKELQTRLKAKILNQAEALSLEMHFGPYDRYLDELGQTQDQSSSQGQGVQGLQGLQDFNALDRFDPPFPIKIQVHSDTIDFSALKPLLPQSAKQFAQVQTKGDLRLKLEPHQNIELSGEWQVNQLKLDQQSAAVNIKLIPQLAFKIQPKQQALTLSFGKTSLSLNDMSLGLNGQILTGPNQLKLDGLSMMSQGVSFEKIFRILPKLSNSLPPNSQLSGPIGLKLTTSGEAKASQVRVRLDLNQAQMNIPKLFQKASGDPLGLQASMFLQAQQIEIKTFEFYLGQAKLILSGIIQPLAQEQRLNLETRLQGLSIQELSRHLPLVQQELNRNQVKASGEISFESSISAKIKDTEQQIDLQSALAIQGADLDTNELKIKGSGGIRFDLKQSNQKDLFVLFDSNLSNLNLKFGELFHKPRSQAFDIEFELKKRAESLTIPKFNIHLADLRLRGVGAQTNDHYELNAQLKPSSLSSFLTMFSASQHMGTDLRQGQLGFALKVASGKTANDLQVQLNHLTFKAPKNIITADLSLKNLANPQVRFKVVAPKFDLDRLVPSASANKSTNKSQVNPKNSQDKGAKTSSTASQSAQQLAYSVQGTVKVKKGQAQGIRFKDLDISLTANQNRVELQKGSVKVFGGSIDVAPLKLKLSKKNLSDWQGQLQLKGIQLRQAQKALMHRTTVKGKMSGALKVQGQGQEWKKLSQSLLGDGAIKLENLEVQGFDLSNALIKSASKAIKSKVKSYKVPKLKSRTLKLRKLDEEISFKAGKLTFKEQIKTRLDQSPLSLKGGIGLDGALDFDAQLKLSAKQVSRWFKMPIKGKQSFPLNFKLGGNLFKPTIKDFSALTLITAAALAYGISNLVDSETQEKLLEGMNQITTKGKQIKKRVEKKVKEAKAQVTKQVKKRAKEAQAKIEQETKEQIESGKTKLKEESQKAKKRAGKAAKQAKEKAKQKAKEALKGLF